MEYGDYLSGATPSTVGVVIMVGTVTFTAVAMASRSWLLGDSRAILAAIHFRAAEQQQAAENSFISIFILLFHAMIYGLIIILCYVLEHHPPFPHHERTSFDPDYLLLLFMLIGLYSLSTFRRNDGAPDNEDDWRSSKLGRDLDHNDGATVATGLPSLRSRRSAGSGNSASKRSDQSREATTPKATNNNTNGGFDKVAPTKRSHSVGDASHVTDQSSVLSVEDVELTPKAMREKSPLLKSLEEDSIVPRSVAESTLTSAPTGAGGDDLSDVLLDESHSRASINGFSKDETMSLASQSYLEQRRGKPRKKSDFELLNMDQTFEWKGFLSICFLAYQLVDAESFPTDVNLFYNASRVGASCFVFLTGFGHAMYFYTRNNYRFSRVLRVLIRINLTCFFLCITMSNKYIFYSICPLHSMAFLMTYGVMRANRTWNYGRFGLRFKLLVLGVIIFLLWDIRRTFIFRIIFNAVFSQGPPSTGLEMGPLFEWYYQTHMSHWAAFVGMIYALNYPITNLLLEKTENLTSTQATLAKATVGIAIAVASSFWITGPFTSDRLSFNLTHPYFAFLPILSYVYLRNSTPFLRERHMTVLRWIGQFSLEIYLFHHHLFLSNNGKRVLVLLPGYPKLNLLLLLALLFFVAQAVHKLTSILSVMLLPAENEERGIRFLLALGALVVAFYSLAFALQAMNIMNVFTVAISSVILGLLAYQTIMDMTWQEYRNIGRQLIQLTTEVRQADQSSVARLSPPIIGITTILVLGFMWQLLALQGAVGEKMPLPAGCENFVNEGSWVPVSACTERQKGFDTREFDVGASHRDCTDSSTLQWGWRKTSSSNQCQFYSRPTNELQSRLSGKSLVFVGDLMVRNLFYALCRAAGDYNAGRYDSTVADHSDISVRIGNTHVEYKWAPLAMDQVEKLKDIRKRSRSGKNSPDLIVAGGGTMDRLHIWATDEDQESQKDAVAKLAKELEYGVAPTIWCTPTTINTQALGSDEKRNQMNELAIQQVRAMYADLDVEVSSNFVLDGPSYSRGRVAESFDGILYPHSVYDAGIQIMINSFDWLLPFERSSDDEFFQPPNIGRLASSFLGVMMLCFGVIGLFFFDGYLGFSYLSSLFVRRVNPRRQHLTNQIDVLSAIMPTDLYEEAYIPYHQKLKLPVPRVRGSSSSRNQSNGIARFKTSESILRSNRIGDSDLLSILDGSDLGSAPGDRIGSHRRNTGRSRRR